MVITKEAEERLLKLARIRFYFNENNIDNFNFSKRKIGYVANQLGETMSIVEELLAEIGIDWRNYSGLKSRCGKFNFNQVNKEEGKSKTLL